MPFFGNKSPEQVGREHFSLCNTLVTRSVDFTEALEQAVESIPQNALKEADSDNDKAQQFFGAIVLPENTNVNSVVHYLFAYSIFIAANQSQLNGYLLQLAGRYYGSELELMIGQAMKEGEYKLYSECLRLDNVGDALGDFYFKVAAKALLAETTRAEGGEYSSILIAQAKSLALRHLPIAKEQHAGDQTTLEMLAQYEELLNKI